MSKFNVIVKCNLKTLLETLEDWWKKKSSQFHQTNSKIHTELKVKFNKNTKKRIYIFYTHFYCAGHGMCIFVKVRHSAFLSQQSQIAESALIFSCDQ